MQPIPDEKFALFALSLPRGHGFGEWIPVGYWGDDRDQTCGVTTRHAVDGSFGLLALRRRTDQVWVASAEEHDLASLGLAEARLSAHLRIGEPPEPVPSGVAPRPSLLDLKGRRPGEVFSLLFQPPRLRGLWALNELYLALPKPDPNWAGDCQTANTHTRMWEALLLAALREQGILVTQPLESPDFHIRNRLGGEAWVEAVTANPSERSSHINAPLSEPPLDPEARFFGPAAVRFAKTIGNKLERRYDEMPDVAGKPFMLAVADFHAPGSMVWSRESLIGYLYGEGGAKAMIDGRPVARSISTERLLGPTGFPAGLFANADNAGLSAVIFTNACTLSKLSRVPISGGAPTGPYRYTRIGRFFDRRPGALEPIPFCLDVTSEAYRSLWPHGSEPWAAELEVFHNPFARHPAPRALLPEATHWKLVDGERVCESAYETSILNSRTLITDIDQPPPRLEDFLDRLAADEEDGDLITNT